jgi:transcriptional regulator with XRE-family HTH domain
VFNIVFSEEYKVVPGFLCSLRMRSGLSQRDVASALGRSQSHIYKIETGQRPIELIEFCRFARALGVEPAEAFAALLGELEIGKFAPRGWAGPSPHSQITQLGSRQPEPGAPRPGIDAGLTR